MGKSTDSFTLLLADVFGSSETGLRVMEAAQDAAGNPLLFGADPSARLHLLAPLPQGFSVSPRHGERIELREWLSPQGARFLDLSCESESLTDVFGAFADSVVERVERRGELGHAAVLGALSDWQELLRPARLLSEEAARGLFGELTFLSRLAQHNPIRALESWSGPDGARHDFSTHVADVEVKSSAREAPEVSISSLDQLDLVNSVPLVLVRLRVTSSPTGRNLEDMVNHLTALGCLRPELVERLDTAGFRVGIDGDEHRFVLEGSPVAWRVGPDFPGLRNGDIPESRRQAVTKIQYTLSLLDAPGRLDDSELQGLELEMMRSC